MSSASIPPPRTKSPSESRSGPSRHTLFLPILIFLLGAGSLALYQVLSLGDQLEQLTQTGDRLDNRVKHAQYEKTKFFHIAKDVLALADKDPAADAVAIHFKLRKLAEAKPELLNAGSSNTLDLTNFNSGTPPPPANIVPVKPAPATNADPAKSFPSSP